MPEARFKDDNRRKTNQVRIDGSFNWSAVVIFVCWIRRVEALLDDSSVNPGPESDGKRVNRSGITNEIATCFKLNLNSEFKIFLHRNSRYEMPYDDHTCK